MKKDIHPTTYTKAKATCNSCGKTFEVLSVNESFEVEVCSNCHPFYTGDQRIMDTAGRAEKFRARMEKASTLKKSTKTKKEEVFVEEASTPEASEESTETVEAPAEN